MGTGGGLTRVANDDHPQCAQAQYGPRRRLPVQINDAVRGKLEFVREVVLDARCGDLQQVAGRPAECPSPWPRGAYKCRFCSSRARRDCRSGGEATHSARGNLVTVATARERLTEAPVLCYCNYKT